MSSKINPNYFTRNEDGTIPGKGKKIKFTKCKHRSARVIDGILKCKCGAFWQGPRIKELENLLKGV